MTGKKIAWGGGIVGKHRPGNRRCLGGQRKRLEARIGHGAHGSDRDPDRLTIIMGGVLTYKAWNA